MTAFGQDTDLSDRKSLSKAVNKMTAQTLAAVAPSIQELLKNKGEASQAEPKNTLKDLMNQMALCTYQEAFPNSAGLTGNGEETVDCSNDSPEVTTHTHIDQLTSPIIDQLTENPLKRPLGIDQKKLPLLWTPAYKLP